MCEVSSNLNLATKIPECRQWRSGVFICNFEQIYHIILVLTLNKNIAAG